MNFEIVTDSSCNLPESMIDHYGIHVLPLTFMSDGKQYQSYLKGQTTDLKQFYTMMRDGAEFTTSLPCMSSTASLFESLLEAGRDVLYVGFSSGLSGTFEATSLLMRELSERYPDRTLLAVDTLAASAGEGLLVWYAAKMADEGASIHETHQWLEENKLKLAHWFTVDDLMHLMRGGRVGAVSAYAGTMLNIKPVMHVDNAGKLIPLEKVRGRKKSLHALVDHMERTVTHPVNEQLVFITHGDCLEEAQSVADDVRKRFGDDVEIAINYVDPVIGAHAGPGVIALFFLASSRD